MAFPAGQKARKALPNEVLSPRRRLATFILITELRLASVKLHMFLAIDRVSKFTYVEFHDRTKMLNGGPSSKTLSRLSPIKFIPF